MVLSNYRVGYDRAFHYLSPITTFPLFDNISNSLRFKITDIRNAQTLRKARTDARLKIEILAKLVDTTEDTIINWELRSMRPWRKDVRVKVEEFLENPSS